MSGVPLRLKLCLISKFAGGIFSDVKSFDAVICELYREYPSFIRKDIDKFDGCRFGPLSSKAIDSFIDAIHLNYFDRYYIPGYRTPHTTAFKLTDVGDFVANHIISDRHLLKNTGINTEEIGQMIATILCFTTLPISMSTAYSLYLDRIKERELYERTSPTKIPSAKESYALSPSIEVFQRLKEMVNTSWKIVEMDVEKTKGVTAIPYLISSKYVEERYAYLCPKKEDIEVLLDRVEVAKDYGEEIKFLEEMIMEFTYLERYKIKRLENIRRIVKENTEVPNLYVEKLSEKLSEIYREYNRIIEDGYQHVIKNFIQKIAERSEELYYSQDDLKNKLHAVVNLNGSVVFKHNVPLEIEELFKKPISEETWNYGFVFHVGNCIQLPQNTYFTCNNKYSHVVNAGLAR